jgi:uncharacterized membrane protein YbhN (UPF0104 family)
MSAATHTAPSAGRRVHWKRWLAFALVIVVIGAAAVLLGWDIRGWFESLWDTLTSISVTSLIAAIALVTLQTGLTAFGWYWILRFGFPSARIRWLEIFALYAASVALNSFLPANLGTLMYLIMLSATIAGATFAGILGGYAVQKIFYTLIGGFTYLYLFLTVGGSFSIKFGFVKNHPWATGILLIGGAFLIYLCVRRFWPRVVKWWDQAKGGGAILGHPRMYFVRVFLPSLGSWFAMLGVMSAFLHAYNIPISFHTLMRICGGNSIANVASVTPGGAGVTQVFNVASLNGITTAANAAAYSVAQQLVTTAWDIALAIILMVWAFGWSGGKEMVESSYTSAKQKTAEQKAGRQAKKAAKRAAGDPGTTGQPSA